MKRVMIAGGAVVIDGKAEPEQMALAGDNAQGRGKVWRSWRARVWRVELRLGALRHGALRHGALRCGESRRGRIAGERGAL